MQLGNKAGPSSTEGILGMTALQPKNHYNQTISSQNMLGSAFSLKGSWSTCGCLIEIWIHVTEIGSQWLFIQVNLCISQVPRNQMPDLYDFFFFKEVNICWKFFAVLIFLCLFSGSPDSNGEAHGVHQSAWGRGTKIADYWVCNVLSSERNQIFSLLLEWLVFLIHLHAQLKSSRKWSLLQQ